MGSNPFLPPKFWKRVREAYGRSLLKSRTPKPSPAGSNPAASAKFLDKSNKVSYNLLMKSKDFRIKMTTRDGHLIQNREADRTLWLSERKYRGKVVEIKLDYMAKYCLDADCREKGVKLVSYTFDETGVHAIVEWC